MSVPLLGDAQGWPWPDPAGSRPGAGSLEPSGTSLDQPSTSATRCGCQSIWKKRWKSWRSRGVRQKRGRDRRGKRKVEQAGTKQHPRAGADPPCRRQRPHAGAVFLTGTAAWRERLEPRAGDIVSGNEWQRETAMFWPPPAAPGRGGGGGGGVKVLGCLSLALGQG